MIMQQCLTQSKFLGQHIKSLREQIFEQHSKIDQFLNVTLPAKNLIK